MSGKDRKKYLSATTLDQDLLDWCADNLETRIELACDIETPDGVIHASDRNKYVGSTFYKALLKFPIITRTIGEWLAPELQFSSLQLSLSNVTGEFNKYLPGGDSFGSWVGRSVEIKIGLAEVAASYRTIFKGVITDVGGFKRSVSSITITARDNFDKINASFPTTTFGKDAYPKMAAGVVGKIVPIIYGSWLESLNPDAAVIPTFCVNGDDPLVNRKDKIVEIESGTPAVLTCNEHNLENGDEIQLETSGALPSGFVVGVKYYVKNIAGNLTFELSSTLGGPSINSSDPQSGIHKFIAHDTAPYRNVDLVICQNDLTSLDTDNLYLLRQGVFSLVPVADIENLSAGKNYFEIKQKTGSAWVTLPDTTMSEYVFDSSDLFCVRCVGEDLGVWTDNIVEQARHILTTYGGLLAGSFHSSWDTIRSWETPTTSDIKNTKSRVWIGEQQAALQYVLSMLEQIRLEAFINRDQKFVLNALHFDAFESAPTMSIKNWDIEKGSFQTSIDEQNNFNRAQGVYNFSPIRNENAYSTLVYKNQAAITQLGRAISKRLVFPNLYEENRVNTNLKEILKISSSTIEIFVANTTWRMMLLDIGDFVSVSVSIGSVIIDNVPCLIREIGIDPDGLKISIKLWSFQMCPFPDYEPTYEGIVGGYNATIESET
jgi:hypothetical protein